MTAPRASEGTERPLPWRGALALVACASLLLGACGGGGDDDDEGSQAAEESEARPDGDERVDGILTQNLDDGGTPTDGGSLAFGLEAETDGWNPVANRWAVSGHYVASAIFDTLTTIDENGEAVPFLAESVEPNEDATVWTVVLRPDVLFHDGSTLNADAVVATFEAHKGSYLTSKGAVAIDTIEAVDERTVRFTMSESWQTFRYTLAGQLGYVVQDQTLASIREPAGTGPFRFVEWTEGESTVVTRNDDYWRDGLPHLDQITFRPIVDGSERYAALQGGELDLMLTRTPSVLAQVQGGDLRVVSDNNKEENHVLFNHQEAPFTDKDARMAVVQAIDMDRFMAETGREELGEIARGPFATGELGHDEDDGYLGYDPDAARAAAAAYQERTGQPLSFVLLNGFQEVEYQQAQQSLVAMWNEAGIEVEVLPASQADSVLKIATGDYQAALFRMFGQIDPDQELTYWHSRSVAGPDDIVSLNWARYGNPAIDAEMERSRATTDEAVRQEALAEVTRLFNQDAAYLWLDRVNWALVANPRVHGLGGATNGTLSTLGSKTWLAELWVG
jgi:ABC-type transport system substrate-binding protein